jgi:hypothetical protein
MGPPFKSGRHEVVGSLTRRQAKVALSVLGRFGWYNYLAYAAAVAVGVWLWVGTTADPGLTVDRLGFPAFGIAESRTDISHWITLAGDTPTIDLAPQPNGQVKGQIRVVVERIIANNPPSSYGFRLPLNTQITFRQDQFERFTASADSRVLEDPKVYDAPWDCSKPYFPSSIGDHIGNVGFNGAWQFACHDEALFAFFIIPTVHHNISAVTKLNGNASVVIGTPGLDFTIPSYPGTSKTGRGAADFIFRYDSSTLPDTMKVPQSGGDEGTMRVTPLSANLELSGISPQDVRSPADEFGVGFSHENAVRLDGKQSLFITGHVQNTDERRLSTEMNLLFWALVAGPLAQLFVIRRLGKHRLST